MREEVLKILRNTAKCGTIEQVEEISAALETIPDYILGMSAEEKIELLEMWMRNKPQLK